MIIFGSIFTTFELSSIFGGSWASVENCLEPKTKHILGKFSLPKSVKPSAEYFVFLEGSQKMNFFTKYSLP